MILARIVSGGQTGSDRGALDAALDCGFPCGGWCPEGRIADDGVISAEYPVVELPGAGYRKRTIRNIVDSDGTVIFCHGEPIGGSSLTLRQCQHLNKPHLVVDMLSVTQSDAAAFIHTWSEAHGIRVLNVAGPSEGRAPGTQEWVASAIRALIAGSV